MRKYTIAQFNKDFPDDDACLEWLRNYLYPQKIECPICQKPTKHHRIKTKKVYGCDFCGHQISPTAGTIFEHSSMATGQRGWKWQPGGGFCGLGTSPSNMMRSRSSLGFGIGIADMRAWV